MKASGIEYGTTKTLVRLSLHETYSQIHVCKHSSHIFPIHNGLKQGDSLSSMLYNFALEYAISKVQENQVRFE
jgi:hypothetical protein